MDFFSNFMNSGGFFLTLFGAIVGYISWKGTKETNRYINAGHERLEEGNKRLEKSIEEGNKRLEVMNANAQRIIEEGNRRVENILQSMQYRWDQSDEFNKRMLDKILDKVA